MKVLARAQFGNPILRAEIRQLTKIEITGRQTKNLIANMRYTLNRLEAGVGLAAPQVKQAIALAVIHIRPKKYRPQVKNFDLVMINPKIMSTFGRKKQLWEGCISGGPKNAGLFAKVPRYTKIKLRYTDEKGKQHTKLFEGLAAHVIQHEADHLNGILFVDKVKDTSTYMTFSEYKKMVAKQMAKTKYNNSYKRRLRGGKEMGF